jgi:hypothetical protein
VDGGLLARAAELIATVHPDRLELPVAAIRGRGQQGLGFEVGERVEQVGRADPAAHAYGGRRREVEPAGEHGEPPEHGPLGGGEQPVAPVDRGVQAVLPARRPAAGRGEQVETVFEVGEELVRRQRAEAPGGQLDGQRETVEMDADGGDGGPGGGGELETGQDGPRPVQEQPDGVGPQQGGPFDRSVQVWYRQRFEDDDGLALDLQRLPAGGEDAQPGAAAEQRFDQQRTGVDQVLAVVQHEQRPSLPEGGCHRVEQRPSRPFGHGERGGHRLGQQVRVRHRDKLDHPHAVPERPLGAAGRFQDEPGLAGPGRPGHGHQPASAEQPAQPGQLRRPAHETVQRGR